MIPVFEQYGARLGTAVGIVTAQAFTLVEWLMEYKPVITVGHFMARFAELLLGQNELKTMSSNIGILMARRARIDVQWAM